MLVGAREVSMEKLVDSTGRSRAQQPRESRVVTENNMLSLDFGLILAGRLLVQDGTS